MTFNRYLYRYEEVWCGDEYEPRVRLVLNTYPVCKETPCGVWIKYHSWSPEKKFINLNAKKQWASETEERALDCFIHRKRRQLAILKGQVSKVSTAILLAENGQMEGRVDAGIFG